jgi:hypothetical protein
MRAFYRSRVTEDSPLYVRWMGECFDLPGLVAGNVSDEASESRRIHLKKLYQWATQLGHVSLPSFESVNQQYNIMVTRLEGAYPGDKRRWNEHKTNTNKSTLVYNAAGRKVPSGVAIVKDLFTKEKYYKDIPDVLFLLNHCILKTINEAVVESMGCTVDLHADSGRHLHNEKYSMEAVISRNGPTLAHADSLIEAALDMYFKEKTSNGKWHFKSAGGSALNNAGKVMVRHNTEKSKLKFMNGN